MSKSVVSTEKAPAAIGPYSQGIRVGNTAYLSGQIPLDPATGEVVPGGITEQATQSFKNLAAVAEAAGGSLADCVKLTLYLTDLSQFGEVNEVMKQFIAEPYPARATIGIAALPKGALFEVDAVMVLSS
ncbi:MAG: RidA family protein [Burkholderiaceae bacterium]